MNQSIFYYLNNLAGKSVCFDSIVVFCGDYLPYILVLGFALLLIFSKKDQISKLRFLFFSAVSVFTARIVITEIIRYFYFHPRPFVNNAVHQLIFHETTGSFPSGHAAFFFALATAITLGHLVSKRTLSVPIIFFLGAILIGLARVIAGIHWPLDILSGALIGIISSVLVAKFFKKL
ncbi:MAG: phosphatase PAP2 family protein [Patescibacteria group bacterium]